MLPNQDSGQICKILIIDDELTTRLILKKNLEDEKYKVQVANNGQEGIVIAENFYPDLIICDWMMPLLNGLEVCQKIKTDPQLDGTFFILLTGREEVSDRVTGLDSGADEFLCKPIDINELKARVRAGLRISRLNRQLKATNEQLNLVNKQLQVRNELLQSLSMTDAMTGLLNRRALDQSLPHLLAQVGKRDGYQIHYRYICVFMMDVDYFKQVNDNYGHKIGDYVLKILAQRLQANVRPNSSVYRYGGEEIVCVTQGIHPKNIPDYGESLRKAIADHPFKVSADLQLSITISLGGAIASDAHSFTPHDLLHQADLALYQAKHDGRNCVRFSSQAELLIKTHPGSS